MIDSRAFRCSLDKPAILRAIRRDVAVVSVRTPFWSQFKSSLKKSASACHIILFCGSVSPEVQRCTAAFVIEDRAAPRFFNESDTPAAMFSSVKLRSRLTMFKRSANVSIISSFIFDLKNDACVNSATTYSAKDVSDVNYLLTTLIPRRRNSSSVSARWIFCSAAQVMAHALCSIGTLLTTTVLLILQTATGLNAPHTRNCMMPCQNSESGFEDNQLSLIHI